MQSILQTCDIDIEVELQGIAQAAPFIVVVGVPGEEICKLWICGEKVTFSSTPKTLRDAILDLISYYFVFNVTYPKYVDAVLLFFQHYVFQLVDSQTIPLQVTKMIGNLKKF